MFDFKSLHCTFGSFLLIFEKLLTNDLAKNTIHSKISVVFPYIFLHCHRDKKCTTSTRTIAKMKWLHCLAACLFFDGDFCIMLFSELGNEQIIHFRPLRHHIDYSGNHIQ